MLIIIIIINTIKLQFIKILLICNINAKVEDVCRYVCVSITLNWILGTDIVRNLE